MKRTTPNLLEGLLLGILALAAMTQAAAQEYTFTTLAGPAESPGAIDGQGPEARFNLPFGLAADKAGNLYVADSGNDTIRKVTADGLVSTLAGLEGSPGSADGQGFAARFGDAAGGPDGVAVDSAGNMYVADTDNCTIRKVPPGGLVSTLAGLAGNPGLVDGTGNAARFNYPRGVAIDSAGNVYVADSSNGAIRKVTPGGVVTTLATGLNWPEGVAVDNEANVYVAARVDCTIAKVTPAGVVTTLAGQAGSSGSADGMGSAARFYGPSGVAVDSAGNVYVADTSNYTIRKVTPAGTVTTLAGLAGACGNTDGVGSAARFGYPLAGPAGVAVDGAGNVYVADSGNSTIRKVTPAGVVTTLVGLLGSAGALDGTGSAAQFYGPMGLAIDAANGVYVTDAFNNTIRKVSAAGVVTTLAGLAGSPGNADGPGSAARFFYPVASRWTRRPTSMSPTRSIT
jgi:sugar lactone lactonase YvrE